jgi:hypothetical protein
MNNLPTINSENESMQLREQIIKVQAENADLKMRAIKVFEENEMYKASPELAAQMAEMSFHLKIANHFIASRAFKAANAEQAYVMIKAGAEMGMKPVESMQALYCVNGCVKMYGDKMVARITQAGYKLEYLNENAKGLIVKVSSKDGFEAQEYVSSDDPILQKSNAYKFAPKNKMRFHGVRMIASFHLPHLFGSLSDEFTIDSGASGLPVDDLEKLESMGFFAAYNHLKKNKPTEDMTEVMREKLLYCLGNFQDAKELTSAFFDIELKGEFAKIVNDKIKELNENI